MNGVRDAITFFRSVQRFTNLFHSVLFEMQIFGTALWDCKAHFNIR
jgi:hypothetical protein